jgi:large subunit ribosomal protein L1
MGKKLQASRGFVEKGKLYVLPEAVKLAKELSKANFDESVELHVRLGIDPRQSTQIVRGTVLLPHGTGKTRKIYVIAKGEKQKEAQEAGADLVGYEDLIESISKGDIGFDVLVATPDVMKDLSKVAKILGPKGLMPNPKAGTVTFEIKSAVADLKKGRVEYKNDSFGIIHSLVGKVSFDDEKLIENIKTLMEAIIKAKPSAAKGQYIKSVSICSTMGPGISLNQNFK